MSNNNHFKISVSFLILLTQSLFSQIVLQGTVTDNGGEYLGNGAESVANALVTVIDQFDASRFYSVHTNDLGQYTIQITDVGIVDHSATPGRFSLLQNYPNPFNPSTVIAYETSKPSRITIDVYNVLGQKIRTLLNDFQGSSGQVVWDATDDRHQGVPAGLYICSMKVGDRRLNKKMLLIDGHQRSASAMPAHYQRDAAVNDGHLTKPMSDQYIIQVTGEDIAPFEQQDVLVTENMDFDITVYRILTDTDDNVYRTVKIGDQWWMAENLKLIHYCNGDAIPNVTNDTEWENLTTGAYCDFNNEPDSASTWGRYYNWYALNDSRMMAPAGWHVPTDSEWKELEKTLGMSQSAADSTGFRGTHIGSKLAGRSDLWSDGSLEDDGEFGESGFSALPTGNRSTTGYFNSLGPSGFFWSATAYDSGSAWRRNLYFKNSALGRFSMDARNGMSVRLLKD